MRKTKKQKAFTNNRKRLAALALALSLQLGSGVAYAAVADNALPTGDTTKIGIEEISKVTTETQAQMLIKQNANHNIALIDWQSFNVGKNAQVNIVQQHLSDTLINRVIGNDLSQIYGKLNATGNVVLVNPNGLIFDGAVINVGGFAASTSIDVNIDTVDGVEKVKSYSFAQNSPTQGDIELRGTLINVGYTGVAQSSIDLPADFAYGIGDLTNKALLLADGNIKLAQKTETLADGSTTTINNRINAVDQFVYQEQNQQGIEGWDMGKNTTVRNGEIELRSDLNADDVGTVTNEGTTYLNANNTNVFYNPALVGVAQTDDGKQYNKKDYNKDYNTINGLSGLITTPSTGSEDDKAHKVDTSVVGEETTVDITELTPVKNGVNKYMLVNNIAQLQDIDDATYGNLDGRYALGRSIDATGDTLKYATTVDEVQYVHAQLSSGNTPVLAVGNTYYQQDGSDLVQKGANGNVLAQFVDDKATSVGAGEGKVTIITGHDEEGNPVSTEIDSTLQYSFSCAPSGEGGTPVLSMSVKATYTPIGGSDEVVQNYNYNMVDGAWVLQNPGEGVPSLSFDNAFATDMGSQLQASYAQFVAIYTNDALTFDGTSVTNSATWDTGKGFSPIGGNAVTNGDGSTTTANPFIGDFNGFGGLGIYSISNLTINRPEENNIGLFGIAEGNASITNTRLVDTNIQGLNNVGGIAGQLDGSAIISWSSNSANNTGTHSGAATDTTGIVKSSSDEGAKGSITGVGGIVGTMSGTSRLNWVSNSATVIGQSEDPAKRTDGNIAKVGGLVGNMLGADDSNIVRIANSNNAGNVYGEDEVGGIAGYMKNAVIGGQGEGESTPTAVYNKAQVNGNEYVGGIAGRADGNIKLNNVYNTNESSTLNSQISGGSAVILAGMNSLSVNGQITGNTNVGGILGGMTGSGNNEINVAYNAGNVTGRTNVGGLVGVIEDNGDAAAAGNLIKNAYNADNNTVIREEFADIDAVFSAANGNSYNIDGVGSVLINYTEAAEQAKAKELMQYYSFYTVDGSGNREYYYYMPATTANDATRMGASGVFVKKNGETYEQVATSGLPATSERFYANRVAYRDANITGEENVGGLVGKMANGTLDTVYNAGTVKNVNTAEGYDKAATTGALVGLAEDKDGTTDVTIQNGFFVTGVDQSIKSMGTGDDVANIGIFSNTDNAVGTSSKSNLKNSDDPNFASNKNTYHVAGADMDALRSGEGIDSIIGHSDAADAAKGSLNFFNQLHKKDSTGNEILSYTPAGGTSIELETAVNAYTDARFSAVKDSLSSNQAIYWDANSGNYYLVTKGITDYTAQKLVADASGNYSVPEDAEAISLSTIDMIGNQSATGGNNHNVWIVYGDQTLPLLQSFMTTTDMNREFIYDGSIHNLVTDDVANIYGRADFIDGAGKNVYTNGYENLNNESSIYYYDKSSLWSPQHGYKMNSEASVIVRPAEMNITIEGEKTYGLHPLQSYYVIVPKSAEGGTSISDYLIYDIVGTSHVGLDDTVTSTLLNTLGLNSSSTVDDFKQAIYKSGKYIVTINGFVNNETLEQTLNGVVKFLQSGSEDNPSGETFKFVFDNQQLAVKAADGTLPEYVTYQDGKYLVGNAQLGEDGTLTGQDVLGGITANNKNYSITYNGSLKVNKADLFYTFDGYREYGEANSTGYYIFELVGVEDNSLEGATINGFLKSWDIGTTGLSSTDKVIAQGYNKINNEDSDIDVDVKNIFIESSGEAIINSTNVLWLGDTQTTLNHYSVTSAGEAKLKGAYDSLNSYYNFKFLGNSGTQATQTTIDADGKVTLSNVTLGGTDEGAMAVKNSTFTITPVDLTVSMVGKRLYGDLMNTTSNTVLGTGLGQYDNTTQRYQYAEGEQNWLTKALIADGWLASGAVANYSSSVNGTYKFITEGTFRQLLEKYDLRISLETELSKVEYPGDDQYDDYGQINARTNVGKYYIGGIEPGASSGIETDKNTDYTQQISIANLNARNYVLHDGTHTLEIQRRPLNYTLEGSKEYGAAVSPSEYVLSGLQNIAGVDLISGALTAAQLQVILGLLSINNTFNEKSSAKDHYTGTSTLADGIVSVGYEDALAGVVGGNIAPNISVSGFTGLTQSDTAATGIGSSFDIGNYTIQGTHNYTITPKRVTVATAVTRDYGAADTDFSVAYNVNGICDRDSSLLHNGDLWRLQTIDNSDRSLDARDETYNATGLITTTFDTTTVGQRLNNNYIIEQANDTLKINKVDLHITINGSKTYGEADATTGTGYQFSINGLKNGEKIAGPDSSLVDGASNVFGNDKMVIANTIRDGEADDKGTGVYLDANAAGYEVGSAGGLNTAASLIISNLEATGEGGLSKADNGTDLTGFNAANYNITYDYNYKVTKAALTINVSGEQTYGDATSSNGADYTIDITGLKNADKVGGLGNGSSTGNAGISIANNLTDAEGQRDTYLDVGNYAVEGISQASNSIAQDDLLYINNLSEDILHNYTITAKSSYTVSPRELIISITGEKTYGDVTQTTGVGYSFTISGLQNSETIGGLSNVSNAQGTEALLVKNTAKDVDGDAAGSDRDIYLDVGTYAGSKSEDGIVEHAVYVYNFGAENVNGSGFKTSNYTIRQESSYTVKQKDALVTTSGSRVYGEGNEGIAYGYEVSGLLADDEALFTNAAKATSNSTAPTLRVGEYGTVHGTDAVLTTILSNTNAEKLKKNYALSYADDFEVTKADLAIDISGSKQYGQTTSTSGADYTIDITGLKNADKVGGLGNGSSTGDAGISIANNLLDEQGDRDRSLDVDLYTAEGAQSSNAMSLEDLLYINNLDEELLHNYNITTSSTYEVTPAPLYIDIQGQKVYGQHTSTNGADYSITIGGLLNGERISGLGNGTQVGLGAHVVHSGATTIVGEGRLLNVGTYYDTITLDGLELDGGQYRPRNYSIISTSTFTVAPNNNPDIDGARYNGGWHRKRRVLRDIRYLDIVDTGIRIE